MILFPNAKINLGLNILSKRSDGFHNLETVFYPLPWCDIIEIVEAPSATANFQLSLTGHLLEGTVENNIIYKAWHLMRTRFALPAIRVHLHKNIPAGAGLGGGSSDAAFFLKGLNSLFKLGLSPSELGDLALELGSDCPFFINNVPCFAQGKGEILQDIQIDLSRYYILTVYPGVHSSTARAFSQIHPGASANSIQECLSKPVEKWKDCLVNDFEAPVFSQHPEIKKLKDKLYEEGATYSSLSGSGSAVFGLFEQKPVWVNQKGWHSFLCQPS